ncbi:AbfB domain-containing protein [Winogradskya humida]|uniref:Alpha-L-arabinofuranosidase B arabinose-binding domain-containing protein n=1 Tax=Winogradskya humida TaxID=113566 RepID=A0ABQ4A5H6_9ACTN|nr:AbfB domain-containing protein [Actinoplanes humidus]GIE26086.1 hypothetical protein Ahu01nite_091880 [Actinoplanes humidus]
MTHPSRPDGTVYGRGGASPAGPDQGGLLARTHPGATAAVSAGIVAVLALGFWIWRANSGSSPEPASAAPASPAASASASPSAKPSPSATKAQLAAGTWVIAPLDAPDTHLTRKSSFAALSTGEKLTLTVEAGLADGACFSFRTGDGKYLRHFDYRLRFDASDESDLFRSDATFCPVDGTAAGTVRLHSKNYPDHLIHRRGTELYIDAPDGSDGFTADSSFQVQKP